MPAAPARHETAVFISEQTSFDLLRFAVAMPVIMPWQGFNYMRTSIAATPPQVFIPCSRLFSPLRI
jgi:hypothetical protein